MTVTRVSLVRAALVVSAAAALAVTAAAFARADDPPGAGQITPQAPGITRDMLTILAGSPDSLAYTAYHESPGDSDQEHFELYARSASGTVRDLGPRPANLRSTDEQYSPVAGRLTEVDC